MTISSANSGCRIAGDIGDLGDIDDREEHEGHVELPHPLQDARAAHDEAALQHHPAIDESRRVAGDEDEDFGRVAEAEIADGDPAHRVGRHMVEEDEPERQPAEKSSRRSRTVGGFTAGGLEAGGIARAGSQRAKSIGEGGLVRMPGIRVF